MCKVVGLYDNFFYENRVGQNDFLSDRQMYGRTKLLFIRETEGRTDGQTDGRTHTRKSS